MLLQVIPWDIPLVLSADIPSSGADPLPSAFTLITLSDHPLDIPSQTHYVCPKLTTLSPDTVVASDMPFDTPSDMSIWVYSFSGQ